MWMHFFFRCWRWLAAARRLVGAWGVCQVQAGDAVWPALREYPYSPPRR